MELIFYAPVWGQSGFEQLSRGLILALDQIGVNIELRPSDDWNPEIVPLSKNVVARLKRMIGTRVAPYAPTVIYQLPKGQSIHPDAPTICYTLFETDRVPGPWKENLLKMDRILVFSEFNRLSWIESGIPEDKITALPPAVDSFLYNPDGPKIFFEDAAGYTFLTSGDFTERKNFDVVVEAYVKEFRAEDDVMLIMKVHFGGFSKRFRRDCANRVREIARRFSSGNIPKILFYGDKISDYAMAALYRSSDCFVLTSRGEGLGLQYLEAMASGLPIIAADWGAHADYLNDDCAFMVKSYLQWIDDPNYILKCPQALNSKWCQVAVDDLREQMRLAVGRVEGKVGDDRRRAKTALKKARCFTWQRMAVEFIRQVITIYDKRKIAS